MFDPSEVDRLRAGRDARRAEQWRAAGPVIEHSLDVVHRVVDQMQELHAWVGDCHAIPLDGETRQSALWLVSGRTIGLMQTLLVLADAGVCETSVATTRSLHEATMLLRALLDDQDIKVFETWRRDPDDPHEWVRPGATRKVIRGHLRRLTEDQRDIGDGAVELDPTDLTVSLYDLLSRSAHNRRRSVVSDVWVEGREMVYGIDPDPARRLASTASLVFSADEMLRFGGIALSTMLGRQLWTKSIEPLLGALASLDWVESYPPTGDHG